MTQSLNTIVIEIPLREEKKAVSLRIREDYLVVIDKYVLKTVISGGEQLSRTGLITRLVEALAEAIEQNDYDVEKIELKVSGRERSTTAVIYIRKWTPQVKHNDPLIPERTI